MIGIVVWRVGKGSGLTDFFPSVSVSGIFCGFSLPTVPISVSNVIAVNFQSDSRLTDRGFSAKWEAVYPEDIAGKSLILP